jgi:chromosome segregation protein
MASATIVFNNDDGWLPIDFGEVAITRRAYRDGENEYLLNRQRVRLRDVSELLAKSGLAERTYTIIGQGLVDAALSLKAEERRRLFEEAAGIGLYRARKEEALKRLDTTRRNLDRVHDILAELQPRLRSLERQARRAHEFEQVRDDLRVLLHEWYGYHWHHAQKEFAEAREQARLQEKALENQRQEQSQLGHKLSKTIDDIQALRARLGEMHRELAQHHTRRETTSRALAVSDERARALQEQVQAAEMEISRSGEESRLHQERLESAGMEIDHFEAELSEASAQLEAAHQALDALVAKRQEVENSVQGARQALAELTAKEAHLGARLLERQAFLEEQRASVQAITDNIERGEDEQRRAKGLLRSLEQVYQQAVNAHRGVVDALQTHTTQRFALLEEIQRQVGLRSEVEARQAKLRAQVEVLEQAEAALVGYSSGAKRLLEASGQSLSGVVGIISAQLDVPADLEVAIAAALGEFLDAVVIERTAQVDKALHLLEDGSAKAALLPMDNLNHHNPVIKSWQDEGFIGVAAGLVKAPEGLSRVVELLLGDTWILRDRASAKRCLTYLRSKSSEDLPDRVVTLRGEVFYICGPILAGQDRKPATLGRKRQQREITADLADIDVQLQELKAATNQLNTRLDELNAHGEELAQEALRMKHAEESAAEGLNRQTLLVDTIKNQLQIYQERYHQMEAENVRLVGEIERLSEERSALVVSLDAAREELRRCSSALAQLSLDDQQLQVSHWATREAVASHALEEARARHMERKQAMEEHDRMRAVYQSRLSEIQNALSELGVQVNSYQRDEEQTAMDITALRTLIEPTEAELEAAERQQAELQKSEAVERQRSIQAEHLHAQAKINLARKQETLESLQRRIEDDFGLVAFEYEEEVSGPTPLPLNGMVEQLPVVSELSPDIDENIHRQRLQLRRMGPINPEAQSEYQEVKERFQFLTTQVADLEKAEADVKQVIEELDQMMERDFRKTFDAVAGEFRDIFIRLFGGGSAHLVLTDPDNLTETGIDIEARLPGRRSQGLSLLSGGERSLTAAALVFALLKVSPTPFCILDEVDAMLDESNVGRFRELLRELSEDTQFIIVTHNRNTVQVADVIYGVTMGRDSASQVLSLKLDEVSKVYEN